jgi:hypothetical protein
MSLRSSVVFVALFVVVNVLLNHLLPFEPNLATDAARAAVLVIFCVAYINTFAN